MSDPSSLPPPLERYLPDAETQGALGARLAGLLPPRLMVTLAGDLGTGKTTLVRGLLRGLGHSGPVRSPTFTLVEPYELDRVRVYHLDLYRLADPEELEYLGLRDMAGEEAVLLVEWPERGAGALPPVDLAVTLHYQPPGRRLVLTARSRTGARLLESLAASSVGD
jgi:tRNA threonylcarbamoyladenosine biosynthesis protein TsaE